MDFATEANNIQRHEIHRGIWRSLQEKYAESITESGTQERNSSFVIKDAKFLALIAKA
jgi:hypothetical protein